MPSKSMSVFLVILIVGSFGFFASINAAPGDLDTSFALGGFIKDQIGEKRNDTIRATAIQPDGKIVAAGTVFFGASYCGIARYNPNGSLDNSFDGDGKLLTLVDRGFVCSDVEIQPDGKIVVVGSTTPTVANFARFALVRLNANGSLDNSFGTNGKVLTDFPDSSDYAYAAAIQPDGKIIAAGFAGANGDVNFAVVRYNTDGSLDSTFDQDGKVLTDIAGGVDHARAVYIQPDGKILVGGNCADFGWVVYNDYALVRYNTDGSLDTSFGSTGKIRSNVLNFHDNINAITMQSDGKIIASGISSGSDNQWYVSMVRYNSNGSQDSGFQLAATLKGYAHAVAVQTDGKVLIGGDIRDNANVHSSVIRFNSNGSLDSSFRGNEIYYVYALSLQADGKVITAGADGNGFSSDFGIARYDSDGSPDTSFDGDGKALSKMGSGNAAGNDIIIQPDGKIIVVGEANNGSGNGGQMDFALARYNADGSPDTTFDGDGALLTDFGDPSWRDLASAVALQSDGKIVVAGTAGGYQMAIARYNPNGSLDTTFDGDGKWTSTPGGSRISGIAVQPDGKIVVVGEDYIDLLVYRFNADGTFDQTFDGDGKLSTDFSGFYDGANSVLILPSGKILVSGYSGSGSESYDFGIARYNPDGSLDTSFDGDGKATVDFSGTLDTSSDLLLQTDGKIIVAGRTGNGYNTDFAIARLNPDGSPDTTFDNDGKITTALGGGHENINKAAIQPNGKIIAVGSSQSNGEQTDVVLARYNVDGSLDTGYGNGGVVRKDFFYTETPIFDDTANGVAMDSNGRAVIAGNSGGVFLVARFDGDLVPNAKAPFDFDGDGKTDIGIFRPTGGQWWINLSSNNQTFAAAFGSSSDRIMPGDYTGDGKADIAFFRPSNGFWYILRSEDFSFYGFPFGTSGDIPVAADFDGDGKIDPAIFRPSTAGWYIQKSSGGIDTVTFGTNVDSPVVADYDGDGKADIAITRNNNGNREWWIRRSSNNQVFSLVFGQAADKAVSGDYTGDGKADIAFFRPSNGTWYILRSEEENSFYGFPFGTSGDQPTPGDFDGDGKFDAAVFRQSDNGWYQLRTTQGFTAVTFGASSDRPIPNAFVP